MLQEGLGARVGGQERGGEGAAEGGHGEYEAALAGDHAGRDELGDAEGGHAVDHDDVSHFFLGSLDEGYRNGMAESDVVDQNADVETLDEVLQAGIVRVLILRKVHGERLRRDLGPILGRDIGGESGKFRFGARDEDEVVALCCEGESEFLADAVGSASDDGPRASGSEIGKLGGDYEYSITLEKAAQGGLTD